jgi:hypothetical protein
MHHNAYYLIPIAMMSHFIKLTTALLYAKDSENLAADASAGKPNPLP